VGIVHNHGKQNSNTFLGSVILLLVLSLLLVPSSSEADEAFSAWLVEFKAEAASKGISAGLCKSIPALLLKKSILRRKYGRI